MEIKSHSRTPSSSSIQGDQISYKKPLKIKNELNEKRRNALKEYYKLKQLEAKKEKERQLQHGIKPKDKNGLTEEDEIDREIEEPVEDIDLINQNFSQILTKTNRITSLINLINSNIKNIIYNNYYELIKLNGFLSTLNELDPSELMFEKTNLETTPESRLPPEKENSAKEEVEPQNQLKGFDQLNHLMDEIEELDSKVDKTASLDQPLESLELAQSIEALLQLEGINSESSDQIESYKKTVVEKLGTAITELEKNNKSFLASQLQDIKNKIAT